MMEALKDQLAAGHHAIDNYVMMQAAVPAQCYDTAFANYSLFTTAESGHPTPDIYRGYPGNISSAVNGQIVDFFNANDYALVTGSIGGKNVSWEGNEVSFKPDGWWDYSSDGTYCYYNYDGYRLVTNPHEQMAFVARPRSKAAGAVSGVGGNVNSASQVDLHAAYGFDTDAQDHSGEFNWTFQQLGGTTGFYEVLLQKLFP